MSRLPTRAVTASWFAFLLSTLLLGCGDEGDDGERPVIPELGTSWLVMGTAQAGRAATLSTVEVLAAEDVDRIAPTPIGGADLEFFLAGFEPEDLPRGVDPRSLKFVSERSEDAHRLFPLRSPHILARPIAPGASSFSLVPVDGEGVGASQRRDRRRRLDTMIAGLALRDPCIEPESPIEIVVPNTPGEKLLTLRAMSNGRVYAGLTTTSTAVIAAIDPGTRAIELMGLPLAAPADRRDRISVTSMGDREVTDRRGRVWPRDLALRFDGNAGATGRFLTWDAAGDAYVDQTPTGGVPASLFGISSVDLEGEPSLCAYGSELGPNLVGSIYCRVETSTVWDPPERFPQALSLDALARGPKGVPLVLDQTGAVYTRRNRRWEPVARAAVNDGCSPPCAVFEAFASVPMGASALREQGVIALLGGSKAEALFVQSDGGRGAGLRSIEGLAASLFADERATGDHALEFRAATVAPDGAVWLASGSDVLLRVSPDLSSIERRCLPAAAEGNTVKALMALEDGTLLLGLDPAVIGFARWRP